MLTFRYNDIPYEGESFSEQLSLAWLSERLPPGWKAVEPLPVVNGDLVPMTNGVMARGSIVAAFQYDCGRCAEPNVYPLSTSFTHAFVSPEHKTSDEVDGEGGMSVFDGIVIDLEPVVSEEVILALPDYPVCSESCKGLCPRCGTNLNVESCQCEPEIDPRWAKLAHIRIEKA